MKHQEKRIRNRPWRRRAGDISLIIAGLLLVMLFTKARTSAHLR